MKRSPPLICVRYYSTAYRRRHGPTVLYNLESIFICQQIPERARRGRLRKKERGLTVLQMSVRTHSEEPSEMAAPIVAGLCVAATALAGRYGIQAWQAFKARPPRPRIRRFYEGGFQPTMTRREAALILGVRESTATEKVKEAHRRVMIANHPDAGGSDYLASKINEAKDMLLGKSKNSGSVF